MDFKQYYKGIIWTDHALQRLGERGISQEEAWKSFQYADKTCDSKERGATEFIRYIKGGIITIVAKKNESFQWVVLTCWRDPPLPGTDDYKSQQMYLNYKKSGYLGKLWIKIKQFFR